MQVVESWESVNEFPDLISAYHYLAEVQFRFNRRYDMRAMLGSLRRTLVATSKQPERGIGVAEVHRESGATKHRQVSR